MEPDENGGADVMRRSDPSSSMHVGLTLTTSNAGKSGGPGSASVATASFLPSTSTLNSWHACPDSDLERDHITPAQPPARRTATILRARTLTPHYPCWPTAA